MREFADDSNVVFGDVNLSEEPIRDPKYSPGKGGWPTVRYFNSETGYDGASYEKKTSKSMCDELGDLEFMRALVTEKGVPPCKIDNPAEACSEKEVTFLEKWSGKSHAELSKENDRLAKIASAQAKPELLKWLGQRSRILQQLLAKAGGKDEL